MSRYQSKAARERADHFTLPEAVAFIVENNPTMTVADARQELLEALAEGALSIRWQDQWQQPPGPMPVSWPSDRPSFTGDGWKSADIDFDDGTVLVDEDEFGPARRRVLWLHRLLVRNIWAMDGAGAPADESVPMAPMVSAIPAERASSVLTVGEQFDIMLNGFRRVSRALQPSTCEPQGIDSEGASDAADKADNGFGQIRQPTGRPNPQLLNAVRQVLKARGFPGRGGSIQWKEFQANVWQASGKTAKNCGFGEKAIERAVNWCGDNEREKYDKPDISPCRECQNE